MTTPTIIVDPAPRFPACPSFGFTSEPKYLVKITAREGGFERRQRMWSRPLASITASPSGDQPEADIQAVIAFWHAMGGLSSAFRARDWTDFKTCLIDVTPEPTDMPIVASGDSPASYRLIKQYVVGSIIQEREILRPVGLAYVDINHSYAGVRVANELGVEQHDWTLDESTGLLTKGGTFSGTPHSWGGEFDLWCRFDAQLNPSISNYKIMNLTVQLAEIRVPLP